MKTYVILLRGVMPTGKNKVPMAPLREALERAGLKNVQTYIQSGNVIASSALSQGRLETRVHEVIHQNFGGEITVLARMTNQFQELLARNPFKNADTSRLYFTLLASRPEARLVKEFLSPGYAPDQVKVIDDMVYTLYADSYSAGKVNNNFIERKLKVAATTRNYNTMSKLVELSAK
jgi:uncharacterized protein (DUF1697 family)